MSFLTTLKKFGNHIGAYKVHLCPEVKGQVSEKGKPLSNVKIERVLNFSDGKCVEDFTYTGENGSFSLPEVNIRSNQPAVPLAEIFTSQAITFTYENTKYILWVSTFSDIKYRHEYAKKLECLHADISDEEVFFHFRNNNVADYKFRATGIGRWNEDFEIIDIDSYLGLSHIETDNEDD
ncbi:DUF6795 domain-containing protein [Pseudoalteromonas prydzensis]|uniref:DUF6795 domain-containing protein n=1 Tax=Pseudoalteromonas prydzensis TaxID=182141 RepID=UPI003FD27C8E